MSLGVNWEDAVQATEEIAASLAGMPDGDVARLNETQLSLINVMTGRIEYAESRRGGFATIAGGFVAAGIALISISLDEHSRHLGVLLGVFGGAVALTGAAVLWLFGRQTNPKYGFIKKDTRLKRPWKWFYRDALANSDAFKYHWFRSGKSEENLKPAKEFDRQWGDFAKRQLNLSSVREDALQNIKQVYLLHVNERYKNLFLTEVRRVLIWGLISAVIIAAIAFGLSFVGETSGGSPANPPPASMTASP